MSAMREAMLGVWMDRAEDKVEDSPAGHVAHLASAATEVLVAEVETLWRDTCAGNRNPDACESCRAFADVIEVLERA